MSDEGLPDKTLTELKESDDHDLDEIGIKEYADELRDRTDAIMALAASNAFAIMLQQDQITLREYDELTDYVIEWEDSIEHSPFR